MTGRGWRLALASAIVAGSVAGPTPAGAVPLLDEGDAVELANKLADATEEQDVCYGWSVDIQDDDGTFSGVEQGSSFGPARSPFDPECNPYVVFTAQIHYTSELSESADSADYAVRTNLAGLDIGSLGGLGVSDAGLLGGDDDLVIANATALLPALVAEQGLAPPVPIEETSGTIPAADRPTNTPGSDTWRTHWPLFAFTGLLVVGGLVWMAMAFSVRQMQQRAPGLTLSSLLEED